MPLQPGSAEGSLGPAILCFLCFCQQSSTWNTCLNTETTRKTSSKCITNFSISSGFNNLRQGTSEPSSCSLERGKNKKGFDTRSIQSYRFSTVALLNVWFLNNKAEDMEVFLRKHDTDIMCVTETLVPSPTLAMIDRYSCYISPRCRASGEPVTHGGGVGFTAKKTYLRGFWISQYQRTMASKFCGYGHDLKAYLVKCLHWYTPRYISH